MKVWLYGLVAKILTQRPQEYHPTQIHTAVYDSKDGSGLSSLTVSWSTSNPTTSSEVRFGLDPTNLDQKVVGAATCSRYSFCDYTSPCIHHVTINHMLISGKAYYYKCGSDLSGWSTVREIRAPVPAGQDFPLKFGLIGDLGQTDFSRRTLKHIAEQNDLNAIIHAGDLSYADSDQHRWDLWGDLVEPLASRIPWMVAAGNHEEEYPCNSATDRFIAYNSRFKMPHISLTDKTHGNMYYSFRYGLVHFIVLNPYIDTRPTSPQYNWLQEELKSVERDLTPWICIVNHGPWYNSNTAHQNRNEPQFEMKIHMEHLFFEHKVDLVISGHVHAYERSHPVFQDIVRKDGIVYIVVGDGGNREGLATDYIQPAPLWSAFRKANYGFGLLHIANRTHARVEWFEHGNRSAYLHDGAWILSNSFRNDANIL